MLSLLQSSAFQFKTRARSEDHPLFLLSLSHVCFISFSLSICFKSVVIPKFVSKYEVPLSFPQVPRPVCDCPHLGWVVSNIEKTRLMTHASLCFCHFVILSYISGVGQWNANGVHVVIRKGLAEERLLSVTTCAV